eukprot:80501-Rhodomonas_salina.3
MSGSDVGYAGTRRKIRRRRLMGSVRAGGSGYALFLPTRSLCAVRYPRPAIGLRDCYAMLGTEISKLLCQGPTRLLCGTRYCYAMPSTDTPYAARCWDV